MISWGHCGEACREGGLVSAERVEEDPPPRGLLHAPAPAARRRHTSAGDGTLLLLVRAVTLQTRTVSNNALSTAWHQERDVDLGLDGSAPWGPWRGVGGAHLPGRADEPAPLPRMGVGPKPHLQGCAPRSAEAEASPWRGAASLGCGVWSRACLTQGGDLPRHGQHRGGGSPEAAVKGRRVGAGEARPPCLLWCSADSQGDCGVPRGWPWEGGAKLDCAPSGSRVPEARSSPPLPLSLRPFYGAVGLMTPWKLWSAPPAPLTRDPRLWGPLPGGLTRCPSAHAPGSPGTDAPSGGHPGPCRALTGHRVP